MVDRRHPTLSTRRQCEWLSVPRSSLYNDGVVGVSVENEEMMRLIDVIFTKYPFFGYRRITELLRQAGHAVNRKRVQRLMQHMGLVAVYPKKRTSVPAKGHRVYPYLLRGLAILSPNQVWATDITYIPMRKGFLYLVAVMDWFSRYVLSWRLSNTMDVGFCVDALEEALKLHRRPEIFNSDQGSQFTADEFTSRLLNIGVSISMDGKGRYLDNIFVERLWRSVKYEEVYLNCYDGGQDAESQLGRYFKFYNELRPHQTLDYKTPKEVYFENALSNHAHC
jgi:putative transposase